MKQTDTHAACSVAVCWKTSHSRQMFSLLKAQMARASLWVSSCQKLAKSEASHAWQVAGCGALR